MISGIQLGFGRSRIRTGGSRDGHGTESEHLVSAATAERQEQEGKIKLKLK